LFYQAVDFVEEDRQALNFIDDDYFVSWLDFLGDSAGILV
jgi:hypothetical protein